MFGLCLRVWPCSAFCIDARGQVCNQLITAVQIPSHSTQSAKHVLHPLPVQYIDAGSKATKQSMADASAMSSIEQRYSLGLQQLQRLAAQRTAAEARAQAQLAPEQVPEGVRGLDGVAVAACAGALRAHTLCSSSRRTVLGGGVSLYVREVAYEGFSSCPLGRLSAA